MNRVKTRKAPTQGASFSLMLPALVLALLLAGCIHPPEPREASVLPQEELEVVSLVKQGNDSVQRGRVDLAEKDFRLALRYRTETDSIYNNLGYTVFAQNRGSEAESAFREAIALNPSSIPARENLARLLYEQGRTSEALAQLEAIVDILNTSTAKELRAVVGDYRTYAGELITLYRNKSLLFYGSGDFDDALCYSWLASAQAANFQETSRFVRMLFSLDKVGTALSVLQGVLAVHGANVPSYILLDYGIALYLANDFPLAKAAFSRVLSVPYASDKDRRAARLLRLSIALETEEEANAREFYETLLEEDPDLCELEVVDRDDYWPSELRKRIAVLYSRLCDDDYEPLFED